MATKSAETEPTANGPDAEVTTSEADGTTTTEVNEAETGDKSPQPDIGESFFRDLLNELGDGVYFVDPDRRISLWNKGAERITGFPAEDVIGKCCADNVLQHVDDKGECLCTSTCPLAATIKDGKRRCADVFLHHKDGHRLPVRVQTSPLFDRYGWIVGGIETFRDNSERQADAERLRKLARMAFLDELTGISNRRYLDSALRSRFSELNRNEMNFGLIMIDVDHFKQFNDNYGHETGDRVLQVVSETLSKNCRSFDTVGRWGGEEFVVIVGDAGAEDVRRLASQLCALVASSSVTAGENRLSVTISLGATTARKDDTPQTLGSRVDALLYRSKDTGRNRVTFA